MVQSASHAANPAIYKSLPYDPLKDIVDVAMLGMTPYVMVTAKGGAYPTLKSLIDAAKAQPGHIPSPRRAWAPRPTWRRNTSRRSRASRC